MKSQTITRRDDSSAPRRNRRGAALAQGLESLESRLLLSNSVSNAQISISDVTQQESQYGQTLFYFAVSLSASPREGRATVNYSTQNGTAQSGTDYAAKSGKLTFARGETLKYITITVNGDLNAEANESFLVKLSSPSHVTIADGQAVGTIQNDDSQINISNASQPEGSSGTSQAVVSVTLSNPNVVPVTVNYASNDGSATAGSDYDAVSGTLTFAPGETSKTITVPVKGDVAGEDDEYLSINLSNATNAIISYPTAYVTILDSSPRISIDSIGQQEGSSGTSQAVVTVTLSNPFIVPVTVNYGTNDGSATVGSDYEAASGTLTFAPGETSKTITVPVKGDLVGEADEYFTVDLNGATNAVIANGTGYVYIADSSPRFSIDSQWQWKGSSGTSPMTFTVTLSASDGASHTINFATQDGSAFEGQDYLANFGTLTFAPGETTKTITVDIIGDTNDGYDQYFYVNLSGASGNAFIYNSLGTGTIYDVYGDPNAYYGGGYDYGWYYDYGYYY